MRKTCLLVALAIVSCILSVTIYSVVGIPTGANLTSVLTENGSLRPAEAHTATGGSFTTLVLNVTSQTSKWKAYVGNVTGKMTLDSASSQTIYDWAVTNVQGEIYVSRNDSVLFPSLRCAEPQNLTLEDSILGINSTSDDSINSTFRQRIHKSFVIGNTGLIANSSCPSIATYIDDQAQTFNESARFQELILHDTRSVVFVGLLENKRQGFDFANRDFQIIVPDNPTEVSNTYYFYAELG